MNSSLFTFLSSLIIALTCIGTPLRAQTVETTPYAKALVRQGLDNDSVLRAFAVRFAEMDTILSQSRRVACAMPFYANPTPIATDSLYAAKTAQEQRAIKWRNGLEVTGQVYQRLDNALGGDDDEDKYSQYNAKVQAELGWNFFNSGFYQRKSKMEQVALQNKLDQVKQAKSLLTPYWRNVATLTDAHYDSLLAVVLHQEAINMDILNMAMQYTLERDRTSSDKLLDVVNEKMRVEYELSRTGVSPSVWQSPLTIPVATVITVDSARLMAAIDTLNADLQATLIEEDLLGTKRKLTNYAAEMRLTPFARLSYYIKENNASSTNFDVGLRFTVPLYNDASPKRKAMTTERQLLKAKRETTAADIHSQCAVLIGQIERLNRAIVTEDYHREQLMKLVSLRREAYANASGGYNHVRRLEEYNECLKSIERMVTLMRLRSNTLVELGRAAGLGRIYASEK